ncbi:MAG: hypothetical protein ACRCZE_05510 [Candidatus Altimarinota bacterium]
MAIKKAIKKVDLSSDDGVLDLKAKDRSASFKVHKIEYDHDDYQPQERSTSEMSVTHVPSTREMNSIKPRPKFDPDELHQRMESFAEKLEKAVVKVSPSETADAANPKELIKVKFGKFVQLVASRDFLEILDKNKDEELIMSSNLLTDLAGAVEEKSEKKTPVIFLIGLAIGVIITYFLISK